MNAKSNQEFETKVLNINKEEIAQKLRDLGAEESPEVLVRRINFDIKDKNIKFIRLRQIGDKVTLTLKEKPYHKTEIGQTREIEVEVSDFDKTAEMLYEVPFNFTIYAENKTWIFKLHDIEFSIDTWPRLNPLLEVESASVEKVQEGLKLLGLEGQDIGDKDMKSIYHETLGINIHDSDELKF